MKRYVVHAGHGRPWNTDPTHPVYHRDEDDDWRTAKSIGISLQGEYDWWNVYDTDDGMGVVCGWSTGRTSPRAQGKELCHCCITEPPADQPMFIKVEHYTGLDYSRLRHESSTGS